MTTTRFPRWAWLTVLAVGGAASACSFLLATEGQQCRSDADCAAHGLAGHTCSSNVCMPAATADAGGDGGDDAGVDDSPWGCLGKVVWKEQSKTEKVRLRVQFVRFTSSEPLVGLGVRVCNGLDAGCSNPVTTTTSDATGFISVEVPRWFQGFLELTAPPSFPDMSPTLVMITPPIAVDTEWPQAALVPSTTDLATVVGAAGGEVLPADAGVGHMLGFAVDCQGALAAGISIQSSVTIPDKTRVYYLGENGLPGRDLQASSSLGAIGMVNLPQGSVTIHEVRFNEGKRVGAVQLYIRGGYATLVRLGPTP